MDSPEYLVDQFAKRRGVSALAAKRAMMLQAYADEGRTLKACTEAMGISKSSARLIARRFMIDFSDYTPYAAALKRGEPRPTPFVREDKPVEGLALFSC